MDLWDSMHITTGEGKYSAKLCFCFHCTFIDQLFSRAFSLWPTVLRKGLSLLSLRQVCDSIYFSYCAAFYTPANMPLYSASHKTHLNFSLDHFLYCSALVATASSITVTAFHLLKWVKVARLLMKWAAWPLQATLSLSFFSFSLGKEVKKGGSLPLESWGVRSPNWAWLYHTGLLMSAGSFNQRHHFTAKPASQPTWLGVSN